MKILRGDWDTKKIAIICSSLLYYISVHFSLFSISWSINNNNIIFVIKINVICIKYCNLDRYNSCYYYYYFYYYYHYYNNNYYYTFVTTNTLEYCFCNSTFVNKYLKKNRYGLHVPSMVFVHMHICCSLIWTH